MYLNGTKCGSLALCCLLSLSLLAKNAKTTAGTQGLRTPLCFVENKGQVMDQDNHARNDIQYKLSSAGMDLFVGSGQLHYQFKKVTGTPSTQADINTYRMDVTLLGANPNAKVQAEDKQKYCENYFLAQLGHESFTAHSWNKIIYKDVYPNIDWVLYIKGNKVEYDFSVRPGGNVSDIRLEYGGATALNVSADGSLNAETPMGNIHEKKPFAFENGSGKEVAANFILHDNILSFKTDAYKGALTIDPTLAWSTYFGDLFEEVANSVTADVLGNVYIAGYTGSLGLATAGAFQFTKSGVAGSFDAFIAEYDATGTKIFATYFGGGLDDKATSIAIDNTGAFPNIYIAGVTASAGMATFGAYHFTPGGGADGFLSKFDNTGSTLLWSTYYGGPANDIVNGVTVDPSNNVIITGRTASSSLISTPGAYQTVLMGTSDAFVAQFDATGAVLWSTYYGGTAQEDGLGIACDFLGNIYITGQTNSILGIATAGALQPALSGTNDAYIAEFSTAGALTWGTYFGDNGNEQGNGIAVDPISGNIAVIGSSTSTVNVNVASGTAFQQNPAGIQDAFVAYLDPGGNRIWSSYYGGPAIDYGQAVCFDPLGNILITGGTFSTSGIASASAMQPAIGGDYDAYLTKISSLGQILWGTYFGGVFYDYANGVVCNSNGDMIIAGSTTDNGLYGSGGIATPGADQTAYGGGVYDAFVSQFGQEVYTTIDQPFTDTLVCAGGSLDVSYSVYYPASSFSPGNVFSVEMSDATGSFAAPVTIGSVVSGTSGIITCTIPALTPLGTGYRIRITASNPAYTSPDDFYDIHVVTSIAGTTPIANTPVCVGGDLNLDDIAPYTVSGYIWDGPSGFFATVKNPTITGVTMGAAGVYSVTTVHNGCPANTDVITVDVNSLIPPTPTVTATAGCAGGTIHLFANPDTTAPGIKWYWVGPASFTSTMQNPSIPGATVANTGYYIVQDTLNGCPSAQNLILVTVNPVLPVSISINASPGYTIGYPGDTICAGTNVTFHAFPTNGGSTPHYQWMIGSSPVVGAIANIWSASTLVDGDQVHCLLNSSVDCPSPPSANSNIIYMNVISHSPIVYVSAVPGIHVTPGGSITFSSSVYDAGISPTYQWQLNGVDIPGATNTTYTKTGITHADTITLTVVSTMSCTATPITVSTPLYINTNVGVTNIAPSLDDVTIFPNPNNGTFTVKGSLPNMENKTVSFEINNMLGQVMYRSQTTVQNNELNHQVEFEHAPPPGIYFLHVEQNGASKIFRFSIAY
jgi:hypothetical protein